jgi:Effector Associated Constant Component 1
MRGTIETKEISMTIDFLVQLVPGLDQDHPAFEAAMEEFTRDARDAVEFKVAERSAISHGSKGGVLQELVLTASATPSSAVAMVQLVKLWLKRDRHRSIQVTIRQEGKEPVTVEASGDTLSLDSFEKIVTKTLAEMRLP